MKTKTTTYVPPHSDFTSEKFINTIMLDGKKTVARRIFNDMLSEVERRGHKNPKETFLRAIDNTKPAMEVRPKRVGGAVYQVPFEVPVKRQQMLSFRWILTAARGRKGMPMYKRLTAEILEAAEGTGSAIKKKDDVEKMAQANRAFAHYARFTKKK
ncbi:30S ribosomal protein S7 [Candidatus Peregrinibacteria bacterium]|nr:MAG: 30S ribosomal protein S7 [Candidatus Peregrinibacteria bacterium]